MVQWRPKPHAQADLFFTISSVLQNLRQSETTRVLRASSIQHTLLAAGNFGRFNNSIIQASLLQAPLPAEINYAADRTSSNEMGRIARRIIENAARPWCEAPVNHKPKVGTAFRPEDASKSVGE